MKLITAFLALTFSVVSAQVSRADDGWIDSYDALLKKYATPKGVRYANWHKNATDKKAIGDITKAIGNASLSGKSKDEKLAFYLNAYNAWILKEILDDYPTDGPGGGGFLGRRSFFGSDSLKVAGKKTSFTDLENDVIRKIFKEPRIHFALNCASASCPPLKVGAFRAESLDETLDQLTRAFVNNNPAGVKSASGGKKVLVSKIFDWYGSDFEEAGGVLAYINQYRDKPFKKGAKVSFQKYSWKLNAVK